MPISGIRLHNFRCFRDSGEIPIRPLTVIFGRNNAGKSSILDSLFLLRQTLDRPEYEEGLNLRGPLYPAGGYADIVHKHRSSDNITMEFGIVPDAQRPRLYEGIPLHEPGHVLLEFCSQEPQPPRLVRFRVQARSAPIVEIRRGRGRGGPQELHIDGKVVGGLEAEELRFGPMPFAYRIPLPRGFRFTRRYQRAIVFASAVMRQFRDALSSLQAVGAFRTAPERRYEYQGRPPQAADLSGQNVVYALIYDMMRRGKLRSSLTKSLNHWLNNVGKVQLLPLRRISPKARLYEVRLKDTESGRWANFADVGFGIGQAFPVLVEGLRTPPNGIFIVQEPEIHLHPDAQLAMADYLIELATSGRTVIVETHSEAILLRVRRKILEGAKGLKGRGLRPENTSIVYVQSDKNGSSRAAALSIDRLGQVEGWPEGFMEDVTVERLRLLDSTVRSSLKE